MADGELLYSSCREARTKNPRDHDSHLHHETLTEYMQQPKLNLQYMTLSRHVNTGRSGPMVADDSLIDLLEAPANLNLGWRRLNNLFSDHLPGVHEPEI